MSDDNQESSNFVPQLDGVLDTLADEIEGWASALGVESTYSDPVLEEDGRCEWAKMLNEAADWSHRTAITLLTVQGKIGLVEDLNGRMEKLHAAAEAYEVRLEAMADHRRVRVQEIIAQYKQVFADKDPEAGRLAGLCKGTQRVWTLRVGKRSLDTPEQFAEAIDRAYLEEEGAKGRARAEVREHVRELAEYLRLLAGVELQQRQAHEAAIKASVVQVVADEKKSQSNKRGKRGPKRMSLDLAWSYLTVVQDWAAVQDRNRELLMQDRVRKVQVAERHGVTVRKVDAMLAWYAKHRGQGLFPDDPRTLSKGELKKWFE